MPLRPDDLKRVIARYHQRLTTYREALNGLNVYPVPDGDTGTNMSLTMGSVVERLNGAASMHDVSTAISDGSLMGARGNSGVILSQILRGLADTFRSVDEIGAEHVVAALESASAAAYAAVQRPVEGTILTVVREAAEAAASIGDTAGLELSVLLEAVYARAEDALRRTPDMLPVLKRAGVVDAGGAGLLLLLASFLEVASGVDVALPERVLTATAQVDQLPEEAAGLAGLRYEVMFFLDAPDDHIDGFRTVWDSIGDSIVVVGGDGTWNCHIHTDDIGGAIEAGIEVGRPHGIRITDLHEQAGDSSVHDEAAVRTLSIRPEVAAAPVGVVAVVRGDGLLQIFQDLGVQGVVSGGQTMNPSTEDLLAVIDSVPSPEVIVLPNNKNIVPVAEQLDALSNKSVRVVPTRSIQQGIAAMFGYSLADRTAEEAAEDMAAAASSVVDGEITQAVRSATVDMGKIEKGDWLGIADGTIVVNDPDLEAALRGLVATILPPLAELITIYTGDGSHRSITKALTAWLSELHPEIEVSEVDGGQPLYPYLISIE